MAGRLVYRLAPALTGYLYHCHVPPGDREDILQECWIRVHRSRHNYRDTEPVLPWVFAVMRHTRPLCPLARWWAKARAYWRGQSSLSLLS